LHKISSEITLLSAALAACFSNHHCNACPKKANPRTTYLKVRQPCSFALQVLCGMCDTKHMASGSEQLPSAPR